MGSPRTARLNPRIRGESAGGLEGAKGDISYRVIWRFHRDSEEENGNLLFGVLGFRFKFPSAGVLLGGVFGVYGSKSTGVCLGRFRVQVFRV